MSVLHVCGHHIGLKQSPSVVFSSSRDLIIEKQPGRDHSSSDENQYGDGDSKEEEEANEAQQVQQLRYRTMSLHDVFLSCSHLELTVYDRITTPVCT